MTFARSSTAAILDQDAHLIQSFADLNALKAQGARTVISRAEGAYVYDNDGQKMIDGIAGLWCVNIGHGRREMIEAIATQLQTLDYYSTFYNFTHPTAAALSEKLAQMAPGDLNAVYFGNSGSVANDSAIRILHHYNIRKGRPNKLKVLSRHGAYHGSTHLSMTMTTPGYSEGWTAASELVHHLRAPHFWREGGEMTEAEFLDALAEDLTSGYQPMSATIVSDEIHDVISGPDGMFLHGMTYSGHPAAAALTNIAIMEREGIPKRVRTTGAYFERKLRGLSDIKLVGEVRGSHFMIGLEFVKDRATKESHAPEAEVGLKVARACQKRGLIVWPLGNVLILSPTLIMDEAMIDEIEGILREAITEVAAGL